jgi:hypothetical protein
MAGMKAGVAPATITRPMQPLRINRVGAEQVIVAANGNGHLNGNGNGKGRKIKPAVVVAAAEPEMLVEVGGQ